MHKNNDIPAPFWNVLFSNGMAGGASDSWCYQLLKLYLVWWRVQGKGGLRVLEHPLGSGTTARSVATV